MSRAITLNCCRAAGRYTSTDTMSGLWPFFESQRASLPVVVVLPDPCSPTISIAVGALQITLDRGQLKDWFNSPEICIEAAVSVAALYLFIVHMITTRKPRFLDPSLFKDRNFVGGLVLMFVMGLVLLASSALISPYLQDLSGRSVTQTGFLMVPRGFGVMFAMMFAGRLTMKVDPRIIMTVGAILMLWSLWAMR